MLRREILRGCRGFGSMGSEDVETAATKHYTSKHMRMLELFAGSRSMAKAANELGMHALTTDINPYEGIDVVGDILSLPMENWLAFKPDVIHASPPCFLGRELVLTARGHVPISDVLVGDLVLTHKSRWRRVERIGSKHACALRKVKGYGVYEIMCTPNHPFLTRDRTSRTTRVNRKSVRISALGQSEWTPASDLLNKHWALPVSAEPLSYWMLLDPYAVGRWLGDGWASVEHGSVSICCAHKEVESLRAALAKSGHAWKEESSRTAHKFHLYGRAIAKWLTDNFGRGAGGKVIPGWVFGAEEEVRAAILRGYTDADGHNTIRGRGGAKITTLSTISKPLAHGVAMLARTLGMNATISWHKRSPTCVIEGRIVNQRSSWTVTISKPNPSKSHFTICDDGLGYGAVRSVEVDGWDSLVYDLQVEEDHSYTINNVVVHNCTAFSVASIGHHWTGGHRAYIPKTEEAVLGQALMRKAIEIIEACKPKVWYIENPRGLMRKMPEMEALPIRHTVWYCRYGDSRAKPTDIWTNNELWLPLPVCHNGNPDCHHERAPRGAKTGTQGLKNAHLRSHMPRQLCMEMMNAATHKAARN